MPGPNADPTLAAFGAVIRERRLELEWSMEELAHRSGLTVGYVGSIERGRRNPSLTSIRSLAAAFEMSGSDLLAAAESGVG